ncbi:MAG: PTS glucose transporter subunit IIA [Microbacterium sp.]|uniref:glucose PTS transporter subunit IIA n=1 Tax=Microbacterium sp. TaxID=51671 RepID=UPI001AC221EE|nr:glucose PTS transporter subunit IIA [Microbacterium sp.]MBN9177412.1 PTS glucose transporter subunit IIA [Microbacterium sp.]
MSTTTTDAALARRIGDLVGGPANVASVHNCTTRLRFVVRDDGKVDYEGLSQTPGVIQAVKAGGQVQVVIGTHVDRVRDDLVGLPGWSAMGDGAAEGAGKRRPLDVVFDFLGATFQPLIPAITGAALVQVLVLLLTQFGWLAADSPTAGVMTAAGNAIFYFLPVFAAFTASRKLGANPFVGAAIAAALLHPAFTALGAQGTQVQAFGLPLFLYSYASSMFPALMLALALGGLDRLLKRYLPRALQQVFVPTIEILVLVPATALVFGPIGVLFGNVIGDGLAWLSGNVPFAFYVIVPALWIFLVSMGIHWALISIALVELAAGKSVILGAAFGYQYAMFGVALGMVILAARQRNKKLRDTAVAATISVGVGGITEPTLYGLVLPYRRVLAIEMISAAASGLVLGLFSTFAIGFSPAPILALPLLSPTLGAVLALVVGLALPIILLQVWGFQKKGAAEAVDAADAGDAAASATRGTGSAGVGFRGLVDTGTRTATVIVVAPIEGEVIPLAKVPDPIFAGSLIGPGVAIAPSATADRVVAPVSGVVVAAPVSGHAVGLRADDGTELLIHVGIDTVKLNGEHFTLVVGQGDHVEAGQPLIRFDAAAIAAAGYSLVTPVVVTNIAGDQRVVDVAEGVVSEGAALFTVNPAG